MATIYRATEEITVTHIIMFDKVQFILSVIKEHKNNSRYSVYVV